MRYSPPNSGADSPAATIRTLDTLVLTLWTLLPALEASALTLGTSVNVGLPRDGPGSSPQDLDLQNDPFAKLSELSVLDLVDYNASTPTIFEGSAFGMATPSSIGLRTTYLATSYMPEIRNEGAFVTATAQLFRLASESSHRPKSISVSPASSSGFSDDPPDRLRI